MNHNASLCPGPLLLPLIRPARPYAVLILLSLAVELSAVLIPADLALGQSLENQTYACGAYGVSDYGSNNCVPAAPTLTNPAEFYDRLAFTLNPRDYEVDYLYALAISSDDFATTRYISMSLTVVDELAAADWQTFGDWGGEAGAVVTGLSAGTDYAIKVASRQGASIESAYSPPAAASTVWPSLTFQVDDSGDMGTWKEENNYSSTSVSTLTTSTNAYNGYSIYAYATQPLTRQHGVETIANVSASYADPSSWLSGPGFGYTTNDASIAGMPKWSADPCPGDDGPPLCYAPFTLTPPGDVVADHESTLSTAPIIDEAFSVTYKVATDATQAAGMYSTTIVYTIVPAY